MPIGRSHWLRISRSREGDAGPRPVASVLSRSRLSSLCPSLDRGMFPDTPAVLETTQMVVAVEDSPKPPPQRITLTLPAIQRSREVWLMVSGAAKADAAAAAIGGAQPVSLTGRRGCRARDHALAARRRGRVQASRQPRAVGLTPGKCSRPGYNYRHGRRTRAQRPERSRIENRDPETEGVER